MYTCIYIHTLNILIIMIMIIMIMIIIVIVYIYIYIYMYTHIVRSAMSGQGAGRLAADHPAPQVGLPPAGRSLLHGLGPTRLFLPLPPPLRVQGLLLLLQRRALGTGHQRGVAALALRPGSSRGGGRRVGAAGDQRQALLI